jgi:hypothetical protein
MYYQGINGKKCDVFSLELPCTGTGGRDYGLAPFKPVFPTSSPVLPYPWPETSLDEDTLVYPSEQIIS